MPNRKLWLNDGKMEAKDEHGRKKSGDPHGPGHVLRERRAQEKPASRREGPDYRGEEQPRGGRRVQLRSQEIRSTQCHADEDGEETVSPRNRDER